MSIRYPAQHDEQGFTLVELMIGMAMMGIIFAAIFTFLNVQRKYFAVQEQITEMVQGARAGMDMLTYEIQLAGYNPNPTGAPWNGITYDTSQIRIKADLNGNGFVTIAGNPNEDITYRYYNTSDYPFQIKRETIDGGESGFQPFAENVQAFTFAYLDANGNATTVTANIRQIRVTITTRTPKPDPNYSSNGGYRTYTLTSLIIPRNLNLR